ncbi:hypothetical protein [Halomicrococcus sp. SG-WS-1]|uniref:hypothetical protein n=1 Tax=Halomicrococcus sp. SG-WS-1 TaxID=3439057 RepID=UPI003F7B07B0
MTASNRRWAWLSIAIIGLGGVVANLLYYAMYGALLTNYGVGGVFVYAALGIVSGYAYRSEHVPESTGPD